MRLAEGDRVAVAFGQADQAVGRSIDKTSAEVLAAKTIEAQELADGKGDRAIFRRDAKKLALQVGISPDFRLCDQAVHRVVEFGEDGNGIIPGERRLDEERGCDMR